VPAAGTTQTGFVVFGDTVDQHPSHGRQRVSGFAVWAAALAAVRTSAAAIHDMEIFMVLTPIRARCQIMANGRRLRNNAGAGASRQP
jgi:hypothetical protein